MCLAGVLVAWWSLTQEVDVRHARVFLVNDIFLSLNLLNSVIQIYKHLGIKTLVNHSAFNIQIEVKKRTTK